MPVTFLGVRHHSPACARLVRDTIRTLRPAHVLVEGPADMNDRLDELLLGHELPVAVFTSYRDEDTRHVSWAPLCEHSPEWVALTEGRAAGAEVRFIDLPAWHPAFADLENRYADPERRYEQVLDRLCRDFAVDNIDTLWDHLFETGTTDLATELAAYFDLVRGTDLASRSDLIREEYMASWITAAATDTPTDPVLVVTGGFHRPALIARCTATGFPVAHFGAPSGLPGPRADCPESATPATRPADNAAHHRPDFPPGRPATSLGSADTSPGRVDIGTRWPEVPAFPDGAVGGSYLVPFSFRRLDAFAGYQSGMPSPAYYQRLWAEGAERAAEAITEAVVSRLRMRGQVVSTADLIGARALTLGLSRLRGHDVPTRTDVLDGLAGGLISDALDRPLPWTGSGRLRAGTDPVVVEMVAALSGDAVGRLHADTPHPPLVGDAARELARCAVPDPGRATLDLTTAAGLDTSRVLHRLRILEIPGFARWMGPTAGDAPVLGERWEITDSPNRLPALIEAGAFGATCAEAAAARIGDRVARDTDPGQLADALFDAVLCGSSGLAEQIVGTLRDTIETVSDTNGLGRLLAVTLGLWRHDRVFGASGAPALAAVLDAAVLRALWLIEGIRGGPAPADPGLLHALIAVRDAVLHAERILTVARADVVGVFHRCSAADRPPALRGAALGLVSVLAPEQTADLARAIRSAAAPAVFGDFLAGLFALAREQVHTDHAAGGSSLLSVLDTLLGSLHHDDFLAALPALRQAFAWFPPRERAAIATRLLALRGLTGSGAALIRIRADPEALAHAQAVESRVSELLEAHGLLGSGDD
ncbi:DUF5682 family protein [Nocardia sp. NPDC127579]|uniref:DUF5682 family protein n=1 Tax=Nocardia sp. NPDC127579 TaxID=3345402 RepID=UPI0036311981